MNEIDPVAGTPLVNWGELGVSGLLPTGTVTLLLADVEGSTRLWQSKPEEMTAAIAQLDRTLAEVVAAHNGVRPVEQGEGDSFVVAFGRASDAVECALDLQRAPLAPIRLRIGVHTGEIQLRDEGNYIGPTINRTARLRALAHGGQTVLSGITSDLVADRLPADAWTTDLGTHQLRDLRRPERVVQLCHPDLVNEFAPLRVAAPVVSAHLPAQLTSFIGRETELAQVRELLAENRLVTLTGAGGVGKTRLAIQVAAQIIDEFGDGVWWVDLAPITDPDLMPVTVARVLGLPDQPGRSTMDTLTRFVADKQMLVVLDNCEHLLQACAAMAVALLGGCARLTLFATSREPIGVAGELTWRVPSLSLADEAIELFCDRAWHARPDFALDEEGEDNAPVVGEICARLDGMPLAIELAAARVRALSLHEILDSLQDRFRLLTGGARTAVRRQQTLRASVDWSHALLTEPEQVLLRRLAVFVGGFDLEAAQAVCGGDHVAHYQVLDQLTLLVDKSLVVADEAPTGMRYRLLETVRQYAAEKLAESGEADTVRTRHRDHYTAMAALLENPPDAGHGWRVNQADTEIDNLRAAFAWSCENADVELALQLAASLRPLWMTRGRHIEGRAWFDTAFAGDSDHEIEMAPAVRGRALADKAILDSGRGHYVSMDQAQEALAIARDLDDPALLVHAFIACGLSSIYVPDVAGRYFAEAIPIARAVNDRWGLSYLLAAQAYGAVLAGDPIAARAAGEEGRDLADAIGDRAGSRWCAECVGWAQIMHGELGGAATQFDNARAEADTANDAAAVFLGLMGFGYALAYQGDSRAARAAAEACAAAAAELGLLLQTAAFAAVAMAALARGDVDTARDASEVLVQRVAGVHGQGPMNVEPMAQVALAAGDLIAARHWADDAVSTTKGWFRMLSLTTRARVTSAQGELEQAESDLHDALTLAFDLQAGSGVADILECLADLRSGGGSHREAARLFGAAGANRQRIGEARFKIWDTDHDTVVTAVREALGQDDFDVACAEGAVLSTEEAIGYAQRGRGERKRPASGWESLTPTERDVVRLVSDGLANKDIAARLFVSPRTVQSHLTHVYTKLGLSSRVQLVQEAARHP